MRQGLEFGQAPLDGFIIDGEIPGDGERGGKVRKIGPAGQIWLGLSYAPLTARTQRQNLAEKSPFA
jgi:hypothetical protein